MVTTLKTWDPKVLRVKLLVKGSTGTNRPTPPLSRLVHTSHIYKRSLTFVLALRVCWGTREERRSKEWGALTRLP